MLKCTLKISLWVVITALFVGNASAANTTQQPPQYSKQQATQLKFTQSRQTMSHENFTTLPKKQQTELAKVWNLNTKEYARYLYYVQHTPAGKLYHNPNPTFLLAIVAKNAEERRKYLIKDAKIEHEWTEKLLRTSSEFSQIVRELWPNEKPIMTDAIRKQAMNHSRTGYPQSLALPVLEHGDVLQLFIDLKQPVSQLLLKKLLPQVLRSKDVSLDIFAIATHDQEDLAHFAAQQGITPMMVVKKKVTLNFAQNRLADLQSVAKHPLNIPVLSLTRSGETVIVDNQEIGND